ncbi:MAG TPA: hypothetical protein VMD53_05980 [Rhizomicrobium sp.]|nr:hypothetical protein [Rhizomicrobium sp.]
MVDRGVEADIAFIRNTLEEGRAYARRRSPDMAVWGLFVAAGYLATYAYVRHWSPVEPGMVWLAAIAIPWIYSLRRWWLGLFGMPVPAQAASPMARAFAMLWLGCGISLMTLAVAANWGGVPGYHWYDAAAACILAIAFFAGSFLTNVVWLRLVAVAWWISAFVLYGLRNGEAVLLLGAAMMLAFLATPGLLLFLSGRNAK